MRLPLGDNTEAVLVPNGAFYKDTGGTWVFVVSPDGTQRGPPHRALRPPQPAITSKCSTASSRASDRHLAIHQLPRHGPAATINQVKASTKDKPCSSCTNSTKTYRTAEVETTALNDVNLDIREGEFVAVMGPSGCGKSTLLNVIGMLDNPSGGDYYFFDEDVARYIGVAAAPTIRKRNIGFIFQSFNLIDELTVAENIELALLYHDVPAAERKRARRRP